MTAHRVDTTKSLHLPFTSLCTSKYRSMGEGGREGGFWVWEGEGVIESLIRSKADKGGGGDNVMENGFSYG